MSNGESIKITDKTKRKKIRFNLTFSYSLFSTPYSVIRRSRKEREKEIDQFLDYVGGLCVFPIAASIGFPLSIYLRNRKEKHVTLSTKATTDLLDLPSYNEVMSPTIRLCASELMVFLAELESGGYNGAARTLRCVLETATEACEFQTERNRPTARALMEEYTSLLASRKKKRETRAFLMKNNAWVAFLERYRVYEKSKRIAPTYKELVNNLNSRQLFREAPKIYDELKAIYEILSDYVHPSSLKFERAIDQKSNINLNFSPKDFDTILELGKRTLDVIQFLYIVAMAHFFEFEAGRDFLQSMAESHRIRAINKGQTLDIPFLSLPFSKQLSQGIPWNAAKKAKT